MDIWAWVGELSNQLRVEELEGLADLIDDFPTISLEGDSARVETCYQQLLQVAAHFEIPWLEVFTHHWYLQHQLGGQNNIEAGLPVAVRLLELAHRDENRECPQSVCAVQDLCIAYGAADGPAYAEERKAVCEETLARIDPRWPCFECISAEYAEALFDEGKNAECLAFLERQAGRLGRLRGSEAGQFQCQMAYASLLCGDAERARKLTLRRSEAAGPRIDAQRRVIRARALAQLGQAERARKSLPAAAAIARAPAVIAMWAEALLALARLGTFAEGGERLGQDLAAMQEMAADLAGRGGVRRAFRVETAAAELHLLRGEREAAGGRVAALRELLPRLRRPCGAEEEIARLASAVAGEPV